MYIFALHALKLILTRAGRAVAKLQEIHKYVDVCGGSIAWNELIKAGSKLTFAYIEINYLVFAKKVFVFLIITLINPYLRFDETKI